MKIFKRKNINEGHTTKIEKQTKKEISITKSVDTDYKNLSKNVLLNTRSDQFIFRDFYEGHRPFPVIIASGIVTIVESSYRPLNNLNLNLKHCEYCGSSSYNDNNNECSHCGAPFK